MAMGRGSDTRMYAPRSESTNMLSSANEDENKYNPTSPEDNEKRADEKKLKDEYEKEKANDIKHLKIKPSQGLGQGPTLPTDPGLDDGNKRDDEREIGLQGGPAGSRGHLLDMATGAKTGTGSSLRTGEPMDDAWSSLLKASLEDLIAERDRLTESGLSQEAKQFDAVINQMLQPQQEEERLLQNTAMPTAQMVMPELEGDELRDMAQNMMIEGRENPDYKEMQSRMGGYGQDVRKPFMRNVSRMANRMPQIEEGNLAAQQALRDLQERDPSQYFADEAMMATGEPMADAWSSLLKTDTPGKMEGRRRREKRREFRPSTGQFKRPPGGQTPVGATMRRFRAHMRGIKGGKKTGLMKPHLSVEMSHRGIATKQPMSKDPKRYRQYMGQQEARKILGNVRTTYSPHARHSARSFTAGPTGGGRLTGLLPGQSGQMTQPALRPMRRPRMPRMRQPRMPGLTPPPQMGSPMSSVPSMPNMSPPPPPPPPQMMMSDERTNSDLLKSNRHANRTEMLALMRMLIQAQRVKDKMRKAGSAFEEGAVPAHPAGVQVHENEDEKNDGPTQNLETDSSRLGLDPAGYLSSKRGHMG
tara:strand:+ start:691 stop:2448 length:1758 start_codon:yes stop_codon:yes gene_type:complete